MSAATTNSNETDVSASGFFEQQTGAFFRNADWTAFWTTTLIAFGVYFYTLAPTVTLEDSGELAVASDYLGVPHPPGYPIWTLITWFFQWTFHWVKYYGQPDGSLTLIWKSLQELLGTGAQAGHPNPAWSVGLMSAFFGALACGILTLLVSRSGMDMLRSMRRTTEVLGLQTESLICWVGGVTGGLLLAFSPVLWSQSTIVEVYSLNAFFQMLTLILTYRWMCRPKEDYTLYITAFIFGLGLTNHQTLLFVALALLAAIWFRDRALFRDCMAGLFWLIAGILFWKASQIGPDAAPDALNNKQQYYTLGVVFLLAPAGLFMIERKLMTEWRRFISVVMLVALGLSFYAYLPFSSDQNPPMNWGYPRTKEGFWHALSRGQYERVTLANIFADPALFMSQLKTYFADLKSQFTAPIALFGLIPFFFLRKINWNNRTWLITTLWAFVSLSIVLVIFLNPKLDIQTLFIQRVQLIQSHAVYAIWLGYGLIFGLVCIETLLGGRGVAKLLGVTAVAVMPLVLVYQNYYDEEQIRIVGGAEQNGHDFGWQFGHWQLRGANAILAEISEEQRASYPNPNYPPEMGTNAIFFGGTDPGRFVPTYMIYSANVRPDVYLITQNALADNTYMSVMRDLYGDRIWIPAQQDSNAAFQKYVEDIRAGRVPPGAEVTFAGGRVSVQGVQGVMMINGILARMIFDKNKAKHDFYVEESYVIPWMYPYLEPHGLIMKINPEPLPGLTPEMIKNDREFWDWYTKRLMGNEKFLRDVVARKSFSKLRSALAGLYVARRHFAEAEYAFRQSIELYPLSPEANFRLADAYMQQFRFAEAAQTIESFLRQDPGNDRVRDFLTQIRRTEKANIRRGELEASLAKGGDVNSALELISVYRQMNLMGQFEGLAMNVINQENVPPDVILRVGQILADAKRFDLLSQALEVYVKREPSNPRIWIDLAAVYANIERPADCLRALRRAVELGGEPVRDIARKDRRFDPIREKAEFKALVPHLNPAADLPMNFSIPGMQ